MLLPATGPRSRREERIAAVFVASTFIFTFLASVVAGVLGSLLGLGGGIIVIPVLTLLLGVSIHEAIGASIVSVIATSSGAAAAYVRDKLTNIRVGMFLEMATTAGALMGAFLTTILAPRWLYILFALVLGYSAYAMFQRRNEELPGPVTPHPLAVRLKLAGSYYDTALQRQVEYNATGVYPGFGIMWVAGLISGLLGIGSGLFKVLGMDLFMRLPMKVSTATSNFMIGVTAAASAGLYFMRGIINPGIAAPVALGVLLGALLGTRIMAHTRSVTLRKLFFPVLAYTAIEMLIKGLGL